ncbi:MAG: hypothetical protein FWG83_00900 [Oscillospiraceae bacterium]|nr:hypothetical protein [Oscillospiraceae bacterium]
MSFLGKVKDSIKFFLTFIIKNYRGVWFLGLVVTFSIFVFGGFKPEISFGSLNKDNIIFCTWIVLLFIPLIKDVDIAGVLKLSTKDGKKEAVPIRNEKEALQNSIKFDVHNNFEPFNKSEMFSAMNVSQGGEENE